MTKSDAPQQDPSAETKPATDSKPAAPPTKKVKVNSGSDSKVSAGGAFVHPESGALITASKAVGVPDDAWTRQMLADQHLVTG